MSVSRAHPILAILIVLVSTLILDTPAPAQQPRTCEGLAESVPGNLVGTEGDDVLIGTEGPDTIKGLGGVDIICGLGGNDVLLGGANFDRMVGGIGDDTLDGQGHRGDSASYTDADDTVKVNLEIGKSLGTGAAFDLGVDKIVNTENVVGGPFDDVLTGDSGRNVLHGGLGDDKLFGQGGVDQTWGEEGNDILSPGSGDDGFYDEQYRVIGGEGDDTVSYRGAPGGVRVDLFLGTATGAWGNDRMSEVENVAGSNFNDEIFGDSEPNNLSGFGGHDRIEGLGEADLIDGGNGDDLMRSGQGQDTVVGGPGNGDAAGYEDAQGPVTGNLATGSMNPDGFGTSDTLIEVENLIGSYGTVNFVGDDRDNVLILCNHSDFGDGAGGNDTIIGGLESDHIVGGPGNDSIDGETGNDILDGGLGNDYLLGGADDDTLDGEGGTDRASGGSGTDTCFAETTRRCELPEEPTRIAAGAAFMSATSSDEEEECTATASYLDAISGDGPNRY